MSTDKAEAAVESAIARHIANTYQQGRRPQATVDQIRSRITDTFTPLSFRTEQDNRPPALVAFYRRIAAAFTPIGAESDATDRSSRLSDLKGNLERLRSTKAAASERYLLEHAKTRLMIERQQLVIKNEVTYGFGRIEVWILSIASLALVVLNLASVLWAIPILAVSIGRSWYLDKKCRGRVRKIAEIDALIERIEKAL
jgi:hypothetical protein